MAVRIVLFQGEQKLAVELEDGKYRVGRDDRAEIIIPNPTVSSRHAELEIRGDHVTVRDLGSSNGTFINGVRLEGSSANNVTASDDIQFGSSRIAIEPRAARKESGKPAPPTEKMEAVPPPPPKAKAAAETPKAAAKPAPAMKPAAAAHEKAAAPQKPRKAGISWTLRYWLGGAVAIVTVVVLVFFMSLYADAQEERLRLVNRYQALAAQYVHVLESESRQVPPPILDESLKEPVRIIDREGHILYPENMAKDEEGQPRLFEPLLEKETKKVMERAKVELRSISVTDDKNQAIEAFSYPVRSGGDLLGYVVARPGHLSSQVKFRLLTLLIAALLALIVLHFAISPVHRRIKTHIEQLTGKLSPLVAGFVDTLPRDPGLPELDALTDEVEKVIRRVQSSSAGEEVKGTAEKVSFVKHLGPLVAAADMPWCFIGGDFEVLSMSDELKSLREFANAKVGSSIFETGLSNVQSKQLVQAITEARQSDKGASRLALQKSGVSVTYDVWAKKFTEAGKQVVGLIFKPESE